MPNCDVSSVLDVSDYASIKLHGEGETQSDVRYTPDDSPPWGGKKPDAVGTPQWNGQDSPDIALVVNHWTDYEVDLRRNLLEQLLQMIQRIVTALTNPTNVEQALRDARGALDDFVSQQHRRIERDWRGLVKVVPPNATPQAFLMLSEFQSLVQIRKPLAANPDPNRVTWEVIEDVLVSGTQRIHNATGGDSTVPAPQPARDFAVIIATGELPIAVTTRVVLNVDGFAAEVGNIWGTILHGAHLTIDNLNDLLKGNLIPNFDKSQVLDTIAAALKDALKTIEDAVRAILNEWGGSVTQQRSTVRVIAIQAASVQKFRDYWRQCHAQGAPATTPSAPSGTGQPPAEHAGSTGPGVPTETPHPGTVPTPVPSSDVVPKSARLERPDIEPLIRFSRSLKIRPLDADIEKYAQRGMVWDFVDRKDLT